METNTRPYSPVRSAAPEILRESFSCELTHLIPTAEANTVLTWGNGTGGRLGTGDEISRTQPVLVHTIPPPPSHGRPPLTRLCNPQVEFQPEHKIAQISCGSDWTAVLTRTPNHLLQAMW